MTELLIDGVAVELPASFSINIKRENPFFTKSGEYTYDIELPLQGSVNAQLYDFLHRVNSVADIQSKRRAVLRADNRVFLDGTEIITGWTDKNVRIQLVSGNSEMNYLADDKMLISDLKMRKTVVGYRNPSTDYIYKEYPDIDFCLPFVQGANGYVNRWRLDRHTAAKAWTGEEDAVEFDFIPQPYICPYIEDVIKALGYTLTRNDLKNTFIAKAFLVHSQRTFDWSEMLPGMTVREFLNAVEKTFNASFKIDFKHRDVKLLLNSTYFAEVPNAFVTNVVDSYECATEDADEDVTANTSDDFLLEYDLPSTAYYQNARLSDFARANALVYVANPAFTFNEFFETVETSQNKVYSIMYELDPARQFGLVSAGTREEWAWKYVDFFREFRRGRGDTVIKMPIIPAEMQRGTFISAGAPGDKREWGCNYVVAEDSVAKKDNELSLDELLGMSKPAEGSSRLRIALYRKITPPTPDDEMLPQAFTDFNCDGIHHSVKVDNNLNPPMSLRPSEMQKVFFADAYRIDLEHPVKIQSYDVNLYDTSSIFVINNKRYLCRDIEYVIGPNGRRGAWTGTFYPVTLSDTEVYQRWILEDGRWRDNGVWLDDGRWLDDKPIRHDKKKEGDTI